jgi:Uma2 family endonuclease
MGLIEPPPPLTEAVGARAIVSVQDPVRLSQRSVPQPDMLLLIEVSDTSARYDREIKLGLYTRHGVREVWIVDLDNGLLRTCRGPQGDACTEVMEPARLSPMALPDVSIDATRMLV